METICVETVPGGELELLRDVILALFRALSTRDDFLSVLLGCSSSFFTALALTEFTPLALRDFAGVLVFAWSAGLLLLFFVPVLEVTELLLSTDKRLMSDLSDLVDESVSLLRLSLLVATSTWFASTEFEFITGMTEVEAGIEAVTDGLNAFAAVVVTHASDDDDEEEVVPVDEVVEAVARRGLSKLPPPTKLCSMFKGDRLAKAGLLTFLTSTSRG